MDFSLLSMRACSTINHPLCGCGNDSYTKKSPFLVYNVVVQATNIIKKGDLCYNLFIEHGFTWGGEWKSLKDYQHFQKE